MDENRVEQGIEDLKDEIKKLSNFLKLVGIPVAIMAIVDIIDNIMSWI